MSKGAKIAIAVFLGLLAALFGGLYLSGERDAILGGGEVVTVYIAAVSIPANAALQPDMITTREIPLAFVQPGSVTTTELPDRTKLTGVALVPIGENEQILRTKLYEGASPPLSAQLKTRPGMVAVGVAMNSLPAAMQGLVRAGDRVDVLASFQFEKSRDEMYTEIRPVFQNIEVLAVNDVTFGTVKPFTADAPEAEEAAEVKTVTLALPPAAAQEIILAQQLGAIWLVLRAAGDGAQHSYAIWNNERLIGPALKLWKSKDPADLLGQMNR